MGVIIAVGRVDCTGYQVAEKGRPKEKRIKLQVASCKVQDTIKQFTGVGIQFILFPDNWQLHPAAFLITIDE